MLFLLLLLPFFSPAISLPCPNNENRYKCDKNGFFAKIQQEGEYSFCVTPHNGVPAYDTRTKGTPKCGACFEKLHEIFKNGQPAKGTFVPNCEAGQGDYDVIQCNHNTKKCYCTDRSGKTVKGSEKPFENEQKITCDGFDITIWDTDYKDFTNPSNLAIYDDDCKTPKLMYTFSTKYQKVMAVRGCRGFKTALEAKNSIRPIDFFSCYGGDSAREIMGEQINCRRFSFLEGSKQRPGPKLGESNCPEGYDCVNGHHIGICCSKYHQEKAKAAAQTCSNGKPPARIEGTSDELLAASCDVNHCPKDHVCEKNYLFAYCCPVQ